MNKMKSIDFIENRKLVNYRLDSSEKGKKSFRHKGRVFFFVNDKLKRIQIDYINYQIGSFGECIDLKKLYKHENNRIEVIPLDLEIKLKDGTLPGYYDSKKNQEIYFDLYEAYVIEHGELVEYFYNNVSYPVTNGKCKDLDVKFKYQDGYLKVKRNNHLLVYYNNEKRYFDLVAEGELDSKEYQEYNTGDLITIENDRITSFIDHPVDENSFCPEINSFIVYDPDKQEIHVHEKNKVIVFLDDEKKFFIHESGNKYKSDYKCGDDLICVSLDEIDHVTLGGRTYYLYNSYCDKMNRFFWYNHVTRTVTLGKMTRELTIYDNGHHSYHLIKSEFNEEMYKFRDELVTIKKVDEKFIMSYKHVICDFDEEGFCFREDKIYHYDSQSNTLKVTEYKRTIAVIEEGRIQLYKLKYKVRGFKEYFYQDKMILLDKKKVIRVGIRNRIYDVVDEVCEELNKRYRYVDGKILVSKVDK